MLTSNYFSDISCANPTHFASDTLSTTCQVYDTTGSVFYSYALTLPSFGYGGSVNVQNFASSTSCSAATDAHWNSPDVCFYDGAAASYQWSCAGTGTSFTKTSYTTSNCEGASTANTIDGPTCGVAGAATTMSCKVINSGYLVSTAYNTANTCSGASHVTGQALGVCQLTEGAYTKLSSTGVFNGMLSVIVTSYSDPKCATQAGEPTVLSLPVGCTAASQTFGYSYSLAGSMPSAAVPDGYFVTTHYDASTTCSGLTGVASQDAVPVSATGCAAKGDVWVSQVVSGSSASAVSLTSNYFSDSGCSVGLYFFSDTFSTSCQAFDAGSVVYAYTESTLPAFNYPGAVEVQSFPDSATCTTPTEVHWNSPDFCFYEGPTSSYTWNCATATTFQKTSYTTSNCQGASTAATITGPTCGVNDAATTITCNVGNTGFYVRTSYDNSNSCSGSSHTFAQALGVCHESEGAYVILTTLGIFSGTLSVIITTYTDASCATVSAAPVQVDLGVGCTDASQTFGYSYSLVEAPPAPVANSGYFTTTTYTASTTCSGYQGIMSQDAVSVGRCEQGPSGYFSQTITGLTSEDITLTSTYYIDQCSTPNYFFTDTFSHSCQPYNGGSVLYGFSGSAPAFDYPGAVEVDTFANAQTCGSPLDIHWNSPDFCFYEGAAASYQWHCAGTGTSFTKTSYATPNCQGASTATTIAGPVCGVAGSDTTLTCNVVDSGFFVFRYYDDTATCAGPYHEYGQALGVCEVYGTTGVRTTSLGVFNGQLNVVITAYSDTTCTTVSTETPPTILDFPVGCGVSGVGYSVSLADSAPASAVGAGYFVNTDYGSASTCSGYESVLSQDAYLLGQCLPTTAGTFVTQLVSSSSASAVVLTNVYYRDRACSPAQTLYYFSDSYSSTCALLDGDYQTAAYSAVPPAFPFDGSVEVDTYPDASCTAPVELHWAAPTFCYFNVTNSYTWQCSGATFTLTSYPTTDCTGTPIVTNKAAQTCGALNSLSSMKCVVAPTMSPTRTPTAVPTPGSTTAAPTQGGVPTTPSPTSLPPTLAPNTIPTTSLPTILPTRPPTFLPSANPTARPTFTPGSPTPAPTTEAVPASDSSSNSESSSLGGGAIAGIAIAIIAVIAIGVYLYYSYFMKKDPAAGAATQGAYPDNTLKKSLLDSNSRVI